MFAKYTPAAAFSQISSEPGPFQKTKEWLYREMIANPESSFALLVKTVFFSL